MFFFFEGGRWVIQFWCGWRWRWKSGEDLGKRRLLTPPPQKKNIYIYIVNIPSLDNPEHKLKTTWSGLPNSPIKENDTNSNSHYCHYRFSRPR